MTPKNSSVFSKLAKPFFKINIQLKHLITCLNFTSIFSFRKPFEMISAYLLGHRKINIIY